MPIDPTTLAKLGIEKPEQITPDELKQLTPELIVRARERGQLDDILNGATS